MWDIQFILILVLLLKGWIEKPDSFSLSEISVSVSEVSGSILGCLLEGPETKAIYLGSGTRGYGTMSSKSYNPYISCDSQFYEGKGKQTPGRPYSPDLDHTTQTNLTRGLCKIRQTRSQLHTYAGHISHFFVSVEEDKLESLDNRTIQGYTLSFQNEATR